MKALLEYVRIGRKEFSQKLGIDNPQWIADVLNPNKKVGISKEKAVLVCLAYPEINQVWLLTGEGPMLKDEVEDVTTAELEQLKGAIKEGRVTVESVSPDDKPLPKGVYRENEIPEQFTAYLVPMAAMGGSLVGFEDEGVRKENCERVISPVANADWVVPVCGDSMEPEYPNGSRVYVQQIYPDDFIAWGNVFVLDTTNGIIIKVVNKSEKEGYIRCESLNPSGRYTPFDVPMRSIRAMYRVLLCVSVK